MSKIAFLFPGQGAQTVGMGRAAAESLPAARELFDRASDILGYDLAKLCFEGPAEELDSTVYSQPALFVTSLAAVELLRANVARRGAVVRGHGRLEPGRVHGAGVCRRDGFRGRPAAGASRGAAMQDAADATPSGMVSILGLERAQVEDAVRAGRGRAKSCRSPTCSARATSSFRAPTRPASGRPKWPQRPAR